MLDVRKNNSKVLPQKCLNRINATRVPLGHVHFEDGKKYAIYFEVYINVYIAKAYSKA